MPTIEKTFKEPTITKMKKEKISNIQLTTKEKSSIQTIRKKLNKKKPEGKTIYCNNLINYDKCDDENC